MAATEERWRPIPGWEGSYEVSDLGRVRSVSRVRMTGQGRLRRDAGQLMECHRHHNPHTGYVSWKVGLRRGPVQKTCTVSALVLLAFVGPRPPGKTDGRHLDGNTDNNTLANLAWGSHAENAQDMLRHGRHNSARMTHCRYGHELKEPNLGEAAARRGHRTCVACSRARNAVRAAKRRGEHLDMQEESHRQLASLMASPGRRQGKAVGEASHTALLTESKVRELRQDHAGGMSYQQLCMKYGIKKSQVWNVVARNSWRHVA